MAFLITCTTQTPAVNPLHGGGPRRRGGVAFFGHAGDPKPRNALAEVHFGIGTAAVYRYLREALDLLAAMAPTLAQTIDTARGKAYVILDGTLLRIDHVGMTGGRDRPYYGGKHTQQGSTCRSSPTRPVG